MNVWVAYVLQQSRTSCDTIYVQQTPCWLHDTWKNSGNISTKVISQLLKIIPNLIYEFINTRYFESKCSKSFSFDAKRLAILT